MRVSGRRIHDGARTLFHCPCYLPAPSLKRDSAVQRSGAGKFTGAARGRPQPSGFLVVLPCPPAWMECRGYGGNAHRGKRKGPGAGKGRGPRLRSCDGDERRSLAGTQPPAEPGLKNLLQMPNGNSCLYSLFQQRTIGLTLVSLARVALGSGKSARSMMQMLGGIEATRVQVRNRDRGRRATVLLAPKLTAEQGKAVQCFDLGRWLPILLSSMRPGASHPSRERVA